MLKFRRILGSLIVMCLASHVATAKGNVNDWNNVRILDVGENIVVKTKSGEKYEGDFKDATADSISLFVNVPRVLRQIIILKKDEVKEVRKKPTQPASAAIGGVIGLGAGIGIGAIVDSQDKSHEDPGLGKLLFGMLGVATGVGIGMKSGLFSRRVYEAP